MKRPNCEREVGDMANYCGQCGWRTNKELPPNQFEMIKSTFLSQLYSALLEAHSRQGSAKPFNEKMREFGGLERFTLRDLQAFHDRGFINGFIAGRGVQLSW